MKQLAPATLDVLRHVQVHGSRTRAEAIKAHPEAVSKLALENLPAAGYLATDGISKPATYIVTKKGAEKLAKPLTAAPERAPRKPRTTALQAPRPRDTLAMRYRQPARKARADRQRAGNYQPTEYAPSLRPGAMEAFALPSRFGNHLRWPDRTTTDLDGNPVEA